mmetsp:Transcript_7762/g.23315  ORF Transcript_7762/g.23315 Transcript_7762/m.23315 type:complete len:169 (-) Transcript_7762:1150-1656(-)
MVFEGVATHCFCYAFAAHQLASACEVVAMTVYFYARARSSTVFGHSIGKASMLWAWTRASQGGGAVANAIYKDNNAEKGGVSMYNLDGSIDSMDDVDYFVWQGIRGSTSWPPRVPTYIATTTPASPSQLTLPIIDGAITSMDPTAMAWPWMKVSPVEFCAGLCICLCA